MTGASLMVSQSVEFCLVQLSTGHGRSQAITLLMPIGCNSLRTILFNSWFQLIFLVLLEPCCQRKAVIKGASGSSPRHFGQAKREPESSDRLVDQPPGFLLSQE